ncbi:MAG: FHA domain-containing protein [Nannocystaceae bacterium]
MSERLARTLDASEVSPREGGSESPLAWVLTLVGGPDPAALGRRRALEPGAALELGRGGDALGPRALEDRRLSRAHARIELDDEGPRLTDLGSHNGTFVNGARIDAARLDVGDVILVGQTSILVGRASVHSIPGMSVYSPHGPSAHSPHGPSVHSPLAPSAHSPEIAPAPSPEIAPAPSPDGPLVDALVGCGPAHLALVDAVRKVAARSTTLLLLGPPGAGKSHLARVLHHQSGRPGPARAIHCASLPDDRVFERFEGPGPGASILEGVDEASPALQARLLPVLDAAGRSADAERIIATSHRPLEESPLRPDLIQRLTRWIIHLPPLVGRLEDVPLLAQHLLRRYLGEARALHPQLTLALLRHRWPGNIRELEAVIECLAIDADDGDAPLRLTPRVRALLGVDSPGLRATPGPTTREGAAPALRVDREGRWFEAPPQGRVEVGHRKPLARILAALVAQQAAAPGVPSSLAELRAAGWPDERVLERAGANRVHVALTTLRKLGLRELLLRRDDGYLLHPDVVVRRSCGEVAPGIELDPPRSWSTSRVSLGTCSSSASTSPTGAHGPPGARCRR